MVEYLKAEKSKKYQSMIKGNKIQSRVQLMFPFLSLWFFVFPFMSQADDLGEFTEVEEAVYEGFHDPGWIRFKTNNDGEYKGYYYGLFFDYQFPATWETSEQFLIGFHTVYGVGVIREKTGFFYKALFFEEENPIDILQHECLDDSDNFSTKGMLNCFSKTEKRWEVEYHAIFDFIHSYSDEAQKAKLLAFDESWKIYLKNSLEAYADNSFHSSGTTRSLSELSYRLRLMKNHVIALYAFFQQ